MTEPTIKRVLFLCTGNSARSQIAEVILRELGRGRFLAVSAGTDPRTEVHPEALQTIARHQLSTDGLAPKPLSRFAGESFEYVITLCERAREQCTALPGADTIHWTFADPTAEPDETLRRRAFEDLFQTLSTRIRLLLIVDERG
jgi:protein-tyrosine-phosphatase